MERFDTLTAVAAPMPEANINTDEIFPGPAASPIWRKPENASKMADRKHMGVNAFAALRWFDDGSPRPDFVLNRRPWSAAQILVTGANFGCGSSREMAVWCLQCIGIRVIVAPSFGDIFRNNCFRNGLLPIILATEHTHALLKWVSKPEDPVLTIDLVRGQLAAGALRYVFETPDYHRTALLEGLDEIAATWARLPQIKAFENEYLAARRWIEYG